MKGYIIFVFSIIILFENCSNTNSEISKSLSVNYSGDSIIIRYYRWDSPLIIKNTRISELVNIKPVFCVDTLNSYLYVYDVGFYLLKYNFNKDLINKKENIQLKKEKTFNLELWNKMLIFSSNIRLDIYNQIFDLKFRLTDTIQKIEDNVGFCHSFSYFVDKNGTLSIKALFYRKDNSNISYYKEFLFALKNDSIYVVHPYFPPNLNGLRFFPLSGK